MNKFIYPGHLVQIITSYKTEIKHIGGFLTMTKSESAQSGMEMMLDLTLWRGREQHGLRGIDLR